MPSDTSSLHALPPRPLRVNDPPSNAAESAFAKAGASNQNVASVTASSAIKVMTDG